MNVLERRGFLAKYPRSNAPIQTLFCGFVLIFATPLGCAFFKQRAGIKVDALESEVRDSIKKKRPDLDTVWFNKGLWAPVHFMSLTKTILLDSAAYLFTHLAFIGSLSVEFCLKYSWYYSWPHIITEHHNSARWWSNYICSVSGSDCVKAKDTKNKCC